MRFTERALRPAESGTPPEIYAVKQVAGPAVAGKVAGSPTRLVAASEPSSIPMRVLVIDDNDDAASALTLLVEIWGYEARVGHDGFEAIALTQSFAPHAILLDIGLPGLSGYEAARRLRQLERVEMRAPALMIAVTGYGTADDVLKAYSSGFDHHLVKPSDPGILERHLAARAMMIENARSTGKAGLPTPDDTH